MIRRSISRAATNVATSTIPITSRRCHGSMARDSTAARSSLSSAPSWRRRTPQGSEGWRLATWDFARPRSDLRSATAAAWRKATRRRTRSTATTTAIGGIVIYGIFLADPALDRARAADEEFFALRRPASWPKALGLALLSFVAIFVGAGLIIWALERRRRAGADTRRVGLEPGRRVRRQLRGGRARRPDRRGADVPGRRDDAARALRRAGCGPRDRRSRSASGHGLVLALAALVFFGVVTALLRLRTESVYPCILVHCSSTRPA